MYTNVLRTVGQLQPGLQQQAAALAAQQAAAAQQRLSAMQSSIAQLQAAPTPSVYPPYDNVALRSRVDALQASPFDPSSLQQRMQSLQKQQRMGLIVAAGLGVVGLIIVAYLLA